MVFKRRPAIGLWCVGISASLFLAGCGDKTSASRSNTRNGADAAATKTVLGQAGEGSEAEGGSGSIRSTSDVVKLIEGIPLLSPIEDIGEGRQPICSEAEKPNDKGLCQQEETVENGGMTFVCTLQKYQLSKVPETFVAINPNADSLWPGSVIQSKSLINGILDPVPINERSPGSITMTIATGSTGMFSAALERPSLSTATEAIKNILNENVSINTPAKFYYKMNRVYSKEQLAVSLGINVETSINFDISASFDFDNTDESNRVLVEFTQEYYTIAFSPEDGLRGFFRDSIEPGDLTPYTQEGNPLAYVASVTYGRKVYLLFESKSKMTDIEAALAASFQGYGVSVGGDLAVHHNKLLSEAKIRAYMIGGNADDALEALTSEDNNGNTLVNLKKLLTSGANFSRGNAGVPISYTVRHVKDSSQIKMQLVTEYTARECNPSSDIRKPALWDLKVTLDRVDIDQEAQWCEPPLNDHGEFITCLNIQVGENGGKLPVSCESDERKAKPGEKIIYGDSNHSQIVSVTQSPGQKIFVSGFVHESDVGTDFEEILNFENSFELSPNYEWINFKPEVSVSGVHNGCKATLHYSLEWIHQRS